MWVGQIAACFASVTFVSQFYTTKIIDWGHLVLPVISSVIPHVTAGALTVVALITPGIDSMRILTEVYAPAMFIKSILIAVTILPDANPECTTLHPLKCLTRNDMLPSGHMIAAYCAALALRHPLANVVMLFTSVCLVASRMHYTVDCVLAIVLCYLLNRNSLLFECSKDKLCVF